MPFTKGQKIVFIGDSITDADRRTTARPYGNGYVSQVRNLLLARYPDLNLTVINRGISGDTTRNLDARWERDVVGEKPDWLSIMIGINDVWRFFGGVRSEAVPLEEYTATMRKLLARTQQATSAKLVLMTPYMIEPDRNQPMRKQMDRYGDTVQQLASEYGTIFVPVQAAYDSALQTSKHTDWADDQIHPNGPGHAIIALAFLKAVGFEV